MDSPLRILYITGGETSGEDSTLRLDPDWDVSVVSGVDDALDELPTVGVDCIVCDGEFEDMTGVDFYIRSEDMIEDTPFILFPTDDNIQSVQQAYRCGIDDVVVRGDDLEADGGVTTAQQPTDNIDTPVDDGGGSISVDDPETLLQYRIATLLLDRDMDIEEVVLSSIRSLFGAADDELDLKIDFALESVGEAIGATQCVVYDYTDAGNSSVYRRVNGWCGKGSNCYDPEISTIGQEEIPADEFPGHEIHANQFASVCRDWTPASNMPIHTRSGVDQFDGEIGTYISYPLVIGWELQGVIAVTTKYPRTWTEAVNRQIKSLGEVIITTKQQRDNRIQLKEQNEQLEQFTSVISHDLQNPLSIAKGYVDISLEEERVFKLDEAAEALERMEDMIEELLTLAKQGDSIGETAATDIATVVNNAWNNVDTKQAELVTDGIESMPKQEADSSRLQEAIENLIKNAIDHVGDDVEITVREIDSGVAIGDDGPGIPDDELNQIFDRGYTGGDGTGFGLAIVEEVVDAHGWDISVGESTAGGAEFRIHFSSEG